jgi:hypothetical protein
VVDVAEVDVTVVVAVCVITEPIPPVVVPLPKTDVRMLVAVLEEAKLPPSMPLAASVSVPVVPNVVVPPNNEFVPEP